MRKHHHINRNASLGLLLLGVAALGWVSLLWLERSEHYANRGSKIAEGTSSEDFFKTYTLDELKQFDLFYEQYRTAEFTVPNAQQQTEWIQMKLDFSPTSEYSDSRKEFVRKALMTSYTKLREAYEVRLDALARVDLYNVTAGAMALVTSKSNADTKSRMGALHYVMALLAYQQLLELKSRRDSEIAALITKYRRISGLAVSSF